jgi:hypothetical protein
MRKNIGVVTIEINQAKRIQARWTPPRRVGTSTAAKTNRIAVTKDA